MWVERLFYNLSRLLLKGCFLLLYRHRVYSCDHIYRGGALIVPNHTSYIDPPLVAISWPGKLAFLARKGLFEKKFLSVLIRCLNAHPVTGTGSDIASLKTIGELLQRGEQVVVFPEGSRSYDGKLGEIKSGIGMLALRNQCALIPTYICGAYDIWPRSRRFPRLFGKTACVFGSPIFTEEFAHLPKKEAQQAIADRVGKGIDSLRLWYENGAHGKVP